MKYKLQIAFSLFLMFQFGCGHLKLTVPNNSETIELVHLINQELINYYPDEFYNKNRINAFAVNNGIVIYTFDNVKAKNQEKFVNILEEINWIALEVMKRDCPKLNSIKFYLVNVHDKYANFYSDRTRLIKICDENLEITHDPNIPLSEEAQVGWNVVKVERHYISGRGKDCVFEPGNL